MPMELMKYLWFSDQDVWWVALIKLVVFITVGVFFFIKSTDHVDEGERALRLRGGKAARHMYGAKLGHAIIKSPRSKWMVPTKFARRINEAEIGRAIVVNPGLKFMVPKLHSLWKVNVQRRILDISEQIRRTSSLRFQKVTMTIEFMVIDIEQALIFNQDLDALIRSHCAKYVMKLVEDNVENEDLPNSLVKRAKLHEKEGYANHGPLSDMSDEDVAALTDAEVEAELQFGVRLIELKIIQLADTDSSQLAWTLQAAGQLPLSTPGLAALKTSLNGNGHHSAEVS